MSRGFRAVVFCSAMLMAGAAGAVSFNPFTSFWVLGDSLSDDGNLFLATEGAMPASPPYWNGRFSNGPVWAEHIADDFASEGKPTDNVAYGGARAVPDIDGVPDLPTQVGIVAARSSGLLGNRPLAAVWIGANDIFFEGIPSGQAALSGQAAALAVGQGAQALQSLGFRDLLLFDLPDLATVPRFALSPDPAERAQAAAGSSAFNQALEAQAVLLEAGGMNVMRVGMAELFSELLADPERFGVRNATIPCLSLPACPDALANELAFFDGVHVNAVIHGEIANIVRGEISAIPVPLPAVLIVTGMLALVASRRRGRMTHGPCSLAST